MNPAASLCLEDVKTNGLICQKSYVINLETPIVLIFS